MKFRPYKLATIKLPTSSRRRVVECISYPFRADGPNMILPSCDRIKVRMVPGEPTTMVEVAVADLLPSPERSWVQIFEVRTHFVFPEDMLRYDGAALYDHTVPEDKTDENGCSVYEDPDKPVLCYRVVPRKTFPFTEDRWASFSASVKLLKTIALSDIGD